MGGSVNILAEGSLLSSSLSNFQSGLVQLEGGARGAFIYGTTDGEVGVLLRISEGMYNVLDKLQKRMERTVKTLGSIDHARYRSAICEGRREEQRQIIDGNFVELLLEMETGTRQGIVKTIEAEGEEVVSEALVCDILQKLQRLH